jgi:hypothetical protein
VRGLEARNLVMAIILSYVTDEHLNSTGFEIWDSGQPNGAVTQTCGAANRGSSTLADVGWEVQLPFLCEQEL